MFERWISKADGQFYFHVCDDTGRYIYLQSEGYVTQAGCEHGIECVRDWAKRAEIEGGITSQMLRPCRVLPAGGGPFWEAKYPLYFIIRGINNETLGRSTRSYSSKKTLTRGAQRLQKAALSDKSVVIPDPNHE